MYIYYDNTEWFCSIQVFFTCAALSVALYVNN